jgi:hypothetical protein
MENNQMTNEHKKLLNKCIKALIKSRNQINITRENVRWFDAGTTMGELGFEISNIDSIINTLTYIKDYEED